MEKNIGFKITVDFYCPDMIDEETFIKEFQSDPVKAYKEISYNFTDSPFNFSADEKVVKVELLRS